VAHAHRPASRSRTRAASASIPHPAVHRMVPAHWLARIRRHGPAGHHRPASYRVRDGPACQEPSVAAAQATPLAHAMKVPLRPMGDCARSAVLKELSPTRCRLRMLQVRRTDAWSLVAAPFAFAFYGWLLGAARNVVRGYRDERAVDTRGTSCSRPGIGGIGGVVTGQSPLDTRAPALASASTSVETSTTRTPSIAAPKSGGTRMC
jgi:hypothetical protein